MVVGLWWKAQQRKVPLRPVIKTVYDERVGHVFQRRYWVLPPEVEATERRHELADTILRYTKAHTWHEYNDDAYRQIKRDYGSTPLSTASSFDYWERRVNLAHEKLRDVFGGNRVAVFFPLKQVPELQVIAKSAGEVADKTTEDIPLFALVYGMDTDLIDRIVKELGLSSFYYFTVGSLVNGDERLLTYINGMWEMHRDIWGEVVRGVRTMTVPSQVIDPSSKKPIYFDDYLKRHLQDFEEKYFRGLKVVMSEFSEGWKIQVERASTKTLQGIFEADFEAFDDDDVKRMQDALSGFTDWLKEYSGAFKVWLSFLVPAGERHGATLAYYAFAKTALDYLTLMTSKKAHAVSDATTLLSFLQERFEHWVDEGKKALGLEKVAAPTETLLKVLDKTLQRFWIMDYGWSKFDTPEVSVRMLTLPPVWSNLELPQVREKFKEVARVLVDEPLKDGFEKFPQDGKFYEALLTLINFRFALSAIGAKALGERKIGLKELTYDDETLRAYAKRAIGKFHNELSQVVKMVTKAKGVVKERGSEGAKGVVEDYAVAVIGFSPADFYSLTRDGTCFSNDNIHHPYILGMMPNSYTLRVFVGGKGSVGRAWGVIDPDQKVLYVTNRYGDINHPVLMKISMQVASALFGVPSEALEVKEEAVEEFEAFMKGLCRKINAPDTPYLNWDAIKISVKK